MSTHRLDYPSGYTDPDIAEAEHLTLAAYHLIQIGRTDDAQRYIDQACGLFRDLPMDKKLRYPGKTLGRVQYLACGTLQYNVSANGCEYAVPAPAYDATTQIRKRDPNAAKRRASALKDAGFGWFARAQAVAAVTGRPVNTAGLRPAAMLGRIVRICGQYRPDMPREAAAMLGDTLQGILDKNPLGLYEHRYAIDELWNRGYVSGGKCPDMKARSGKCYRLEYLSQAQTEIAAKILKSDRPDMTDELYAAGTSYIAWEGLHPDPVWTAIWCELPEPVYGMSHYLREPASDLYNFGHRGYELSNIFNQSVYAAMDVCNLIRMHDALLNTEDKHLRQVMIDAKMVDPGLDIPDGLHRTAATCRMLCGWHVDGGEDIMLEMVPAITAVMDCDIMSDLLHTGLTKNE